MNASDLISNAKTQEEHAIERLHHWLSLETKTAFIGGGVFWLPIGLITGLLTVLAMAFTPYLIWRLAQARWYKTIGLYGALVLLPLLAAQLTSLTEPVWSFVLRFGPLVMFYVFTLVLKHVLGDHLREIEGARSVEAEPAVHALRAGRRVNPPGL